MLALPVLKPFAFGNELDELVVTHLTMFVGRTNAGLCQAARNGAGLLTIHRVCRVGIDAVDEGRDDARVVR